MEEILEQQRYNQKDIEYEMFKGKIEGVVSEFRNNVEYIELACEEAGIGFHSYLMSLLKNYGF